MTDSSQASVTPESVTPESVTPESETSTPESSRSPYRTGPEHHGDPDAEATALTDGCGLVDRTSWGRLRIAGEDRRRFLNGQVTCAVGDLQPGQGTYGFVTSLKGRVETELTVLATDGALWLDLPPGRTGPVRERLAKYVIVDRVEFDTPDLAVLTLVGPRCFEVAAAARLGEDLAAADGWAHGDGALAGVPLRWVREPEGSAATAGAGGVSLWIQNNVEAVTAALQEAGAVAVGWRPVERLRLSNGRPLWGVDFGEDTFPQETGLDDAVSYTKGCYLGQEVVARIHYRGGVQRHMRRLVLSKELPESVDGPVLVQGDKEVGWLTSSARSLDGDRVLGLAVVHRRAEVGDTLEVRSSLSSPEALATAVVEDLSGEEKK